MKGTNLLLAIVAVVVLGVFALLLARGGPEPTGATHGDETAAPPPTPEPETPLDPMIEEMRRIQGRAMRANELAAEATLRKVVAAQAHFMATALLDRNRNGTGEAGTFAELSGAAPIRGSGSKLHPPALREAFHGKEARRLGYRFHLYLPEEADRAERAWYCVAVPEEAMVTGTTVLLVTQSGDVHAAPAPEGRIDPAAAATYDEKAGGYVPNPAFGEWMKK